jgi:hypothetical protein
MHTGITRPRLAAVSYERGFDIDSLMLGVSDELRLYGVVLGGLLQSAFGSRGDCAQSVQVADLRSGNVFDIWDRCGKGARGCRLDENALLDANPVRRTAITDRGRSRRRQPLRTGRRAAVAA